MKEVPNVLFGERTLEKQSQLDLTICLAHVFDRVLPERKSERQKAKSGSG